MWTPIILSICAAVALLCTVWDAVEGANTPWKRRRAMIAALVGFPAIAIQCWHTLEAPAELRRRMFEAIAAEQIANLDRMDGWAKPEEQEQSRLAITDLQSAAVKGAIGSALFSASADNLLLESLTRMNELVEDLNKRNRKLTEIMWNNPKHSHLEFRRKIKDSAAYLTTRQQAISLLDLLVKHYGLDPKRQYFGAQGPQMK